MAETTKQKIQLLIEQRIVQATKKEITHKCATVARELGRPIIAQTIFQNVLPDPWELADDLVYDPEKVHEAQDWTESERGFAFDGLRYGINLCITALTFDDKLLELKVTYNGYLVYAEIDGRLKAYAPFPTWENALAMFYQGAVQKKSRREESERLERQESQRRKWAQFWTSFKRLWGE